MEVSNFELHLVKSYFIAQGKTDEKSNPALSATASTGQQVDAMVLTCYGNHGNEFMPS